MRHIFLFITLSFCSCSTIMNSPKAMEAVTLATKALTISDGEILALTSEFIKHSDTQNKVAADTDKYSARLRKITDRFKNEDGLNLNFKVYITPEINAFASADGSIRVYSGLMDAMTDDEIAAIIGHEIGHVKNNDVKDAMRNAYIAAAATSALGATSSTVAKLTDSALGQIANAFLSAQYSQKQELQADDYSFNFTIRHGYDKYAMARALEKINSISTKGGVESSRISQLFSSHPDSKLRATRMRQKADNTKGSAAL